MSWRPLDVGVVNSGELIMILFKVLMCLGVWFSSISFCMAFLITARVLDITRCHQGVTDVGIEALAACTQLQELHISYLHQVSLSQHAAKSGDMQKSMSHLLD